MAIRPEALERFSRHMGDDANFRLALKICPGGALAAATYFTPHEREEMLASLQGAAILGLGHGSEPLLPGPAPGLPGGGSVGPKFGPPITNVVVDFAKFAQRVELGMSDQGFASDDMKVTYNLPTFKPPLDAPPPPVGYAYALFQGKTLMAANGIGEAITAPDNAWNAIPQSPNRPMQIASCTKTFTIVAMLRAMRIAGLSGNDKIGPYIPSDWAPLVNGVSDITFTDLLSGYSGLPVDAPKGGTYGSLKDMLRNAPFAPGTKDIQTQSASCAECYFRT